MKVLVAVDQDLESRVALQYACHLLEHFDAEVDAIHVKKDVGNIILEDFDIPFLKKDHKKKIDEQAKEVEAAIADACEICLEGKVPCEPRILVGDAAEVILREARDKDVDLIVLGCHRSSALREMLLGQVHTQVINHANRPVLIVREVRDDYFAPVGIWQLRETVRGAMKGKYERLDSIEQAIQRPWLSPLQLAASPHLGHLCYPHPPTRF